MRRNWILGLLTPAACIAVIAACGGGSSSTDTQAPAPAPAPTNTGTNAANPPPAPPGPAAPDAPLMTIADARTRNVATAFKVVAVVTAVRGDDPKDTKEWYIQDPAGGPSSGVAVYCNKTAKKNPCAASVSAPAVGDEVTLIGTLSTYKGKVEIQPTSQTVDKSGSALPPAATVTADELVAAAASKYRGALVTIKGTLTVDDVTPSKLYDAKCADGGTAPTDPSQGTAAMCTGCKPPTYAGFQVNDGAGHELLIENYFYTSSHLASSPECTTQPGAVAVAKGATFTSFTGIVDFDVTGGVQVLSPVTDSDYTKP